MRRGNWHVRRLALVIAAATVVFTCCTLDRLDETALAAKRQIRQLAGDAVFCRTGAAEADILFRRIHAISQQTGLNADVQVFPTGRNSYLGERSNPKGPYLLIVRFHHGPHRPTTPEAGFGVFVFQARSHDNVQRVLAGDASVRPTSSGATGPSPRASWPVSPHDRANSAIRHQAAN